MRCIPSLALILTMLLLGGAPEARGEDETGHWPFGVDPSAGRVWGQAKDLYNLGILGAKARDPDARAAPSEQLGGGRRRIQGGRAPATDDGPERLVVEILYPRGPAERAGLRVGDEIVAVGGAPIKSGSLALLARALKKAESGKGKLTLVVRREGEKGTKRIEVEVPKGGKEAAKPTVGKGRQAIVESALAWLADRQESSGGYPETTSGANGSVVQTALAGLAWLAGGSDTKKGPYRKNVVAAVEFVTDTVGKTISFPGFPGAGDENKDRMRGLDQTNWGFAHAAIFLGELQARAPSPKVRLVLERCGKALAERQERTGGWAHGPGGPNPLGYTELNIVTGLALCGMGLARHSGWEVPKDVIEKAEKYLRESSGGDGGIGYSSSPGQRGAGNIGRNAGCWLGFRTLGLGRRPWAKKMEKWIRGHAGTLTGAHASLMQHIFLGGVAAHALGRKARDSYWALMERDLVLARAPDGSLQPRPWHESVSMGHNTDVTFGEVWTTAAWTIVLACEPEKRVRPGLPAWMTD